MTPEHSAAGALARSALPGHPVAMECTRCGACCVAPDISSLKKPLGARCQHLSAENLCTIYETRPAVCRSYQADELCEQIASPSLDERVRRYLSIFGLSSR